jgi:WD40 repeat protein
VTVQLDPAVVRLRDQRGRVVGSGFLAGEREVLTCAHVVNRALGLTEDRPPLGAEVRLDFPLVARDQIIAATVVMWHAPVADGEGDVAGLELRDDPPGGARPARLLVTDELWRHEFRTFGFPSGYDDGVWATGRLLARQAMRWVQMEDVKQTGYRVEPGFSGAPVWDDELDGVVGITVAAERRPDVRAAYLIPAGVLVEAWPALANRAIPPCPYRGLSTFREQDAPVFFGREELTDRLVEAVGQKSLVVVIGSSGSGKSSLVFAGLIPRLRQSPEWAIASMRPATGLPPLTTLAAALLPLLEPEMSEAARLLERPALATVLHDDRLGEVVDRVLAKANARRLLLVVDQFEELFALEPTARQPFVDALLEAVAAQRQRTEAALTVAVTLRADFLGQALTHPGLAEALQDASLMLGPMGREQLRRAIEGPAAQQVAYETDLVDRILVDVGENPGTLPLLEFALTLLWESQVNAKLTHAAYGALGGVDGALARYAEEIYQRLPEPDRDDARRLFLQLVRPGEGTEHTRRRALRADLGKSRWELAQRLAGTRLVVTSRDLGGNETVELAHEALLVSWRRLAAWIEADRAFRAWQERIRSTIQQWEASGHDDGALLRGGPLAEAERWLEQRRNDTSPVEQTFVSASRARQDREDQAVRRRNRQLRSLTIALSVLLAIALLSAALAQRQTQNARAQTRLATSRQLISQANAALDDDPRLALLLGIAAQRIHNDADARASLVNSLVATHYAGILTGHQASVNKVALSPNWRTLASASTDKTVILWDLTDWAHPKRLGQALTGHQAAVNTVAFSPDGRTLASGSDDKTVILWDVSDRAHPKRLGRPLTGHDDAVTSVAFSPDRRTLATASTDKTVLLWDVRNRVHPAQLGRPLTGYGGTVWSVAFSPNRNGRTLATASADTTVVLWNVRNRAHPTRLGQPLTGHRGQVGSVAFSPDGRTLASASDDKTVILWDVRDPAHPAHLGRPLTGHGDAVSSAVFSPNGRTLVSASSDTTAILWNVSNLVHPKRLDPPLSGHSGPVWAAVFGRDGQRLATASYDTTVRLWDLTDRAHPARLGQPLTGHDDEAVAALAFTPDGHTLATGSDDKTVILWDVSDRGHPKRLGRITGHDDAVTSVAFSRDGRTLATASADTVTLWDLTDPAHLKRLGQPLRGHDEEVASVVFSPDRRTMASASDDKTVILWDVRDPAHPTQLGSPLRGHDKAVASVSFSPDGRTLASGSDDKTVILWDVSDRAHPKRLGQPLTGHRDQVAWVSFSPDGRTLASGSDDKTVMLWDVSDRAHPTHLGQPLTGHQAAVTAVAFSPDRRTLATASDDKTVILWDLSDRAHPTRLGQPLAGHGDAVASVVFSPDGKTLATGSDNGTVILWDLSQLNALRNDPVQRACALTGRGLNRDEWTGYIPGLPYENTCTSQP